MLYLAVQKYIRLQDHDLTFETALKLSVAIQSTHCRFRDHKKVHMLKFAEVKERRLETAGVLHINTPTFSQMIWQRITP